MILGMSNWIFGIVTALAAVALALLILACCFRTVRNFLKEYAAAFTLIFAMLAGAYTLHQYNDAKQKARMSHTLEYIARFQSGRLADARIWLDTFLLDNIKGASPFLDKDAPRIEREREAKRLENLSIPNEKFRGYVIEIFIFYSEVSGCVNQGICDAKTACEYFGNDIGNLNYIYNDFVERWEAIAFKERFEAIQKFVEACNLFEQPKDNGKQGHPAQ